MKLLNIITFTILTSCTVLDIENEGNRESHSSIVESILNSSSISAYVLYEGDLPGHSYTYTYIFLRGKNPEFTDFYFIENGSITTRSSIGAEVVEIMNARLSLEKYPPVHSVIDSALSFHHNTRRLVITNGSQTFTYIKRNRNFEKNHDLINTIQSLIFEIENKVM
tara:strand:+ start:875 stop:1372 length:498 start_codon:yes stop_codon:yes gene_type:complete